MTESEAQPEERTLTWDGCLNVRDLGGLPTVGGGRTRRGAVVRADNLDRLTAEGWDALLAHGVRTVVDLRDAAECRPLLPLPAGLDHVRVPLDRLAGAQWWQRWGDLDGTPLSLRPYLDECPHASAALVTAVAVARPGAVVVHCGSGRDRTGLAALLLLALAGVEPAAIVADYRLSDANLRPLYGLLRRPDEGAVIAATLEREGATVESALYAALEGFDPAARLVTAGVAPAELAAVRRRLLVASAP